MGKKLTKETFIKKAMKMHKNKYDYSLSMTQRCYFSVII